MTRRIFARLGVVIVAVAILSGCGYALAGRGNALPASIAIIGVPQIANHSSIAVVDRIITTAVREEFQNKGKYQVRPESTGVDGLLTASISSVTLQPTAFTENRQPSAYAIVVVASVEFKHVTDENKVLWANPAFRVTDDFQFTPTSTGTVEPSALLSQSPQAIERLARKFAREVVTSLFEAF
jgi:hypothetical protein